MYALSEEHQAIREAVRAVADAKIAPFATEVDEQARYPQEAADALLASDFHAPHVPEQYGGSAAGDFRYNAVLCEELGKVSMSLSSCHGIHADIVAPYLVELTTEEQRERLDLACLGHPAHWDQLVKNGLSGQVLLDPAVADVGHERPRCNGVNAYAVGGELVGGVAHEVLHARLRGHVGHPDDRFVDLGGVRAGDDDAAAAPLLHHGHDVLEAEPDAAHVDRDRALGAALVAVELAGQQRLEPDLVVLDRA